MKKIVILSIFFISFLSADIKIMASPICKIETLSMYDIKNLFMVKKKVINDESIIIIDSDNRETYNSFIKKYLKKSSRKMKVYWTRMLFTGKKTPPPKLSIEELYQLDINGSCYLSYVEEETQLKRWNSIEIR